MKSESHFELEQTYAWNWFAYHAGQRLIAFNFFLVVLGAVLVGYVQAVTGDLRALGVVLGLLGVLVSVAFWVMDVRNAELVACGEAALDELEKSMSITIRADDENRTRLGKAVKGPIESRLYRQLTRPGGTREARLRLYTHTVWLRLILVTVGILSAGAIIWAALDFPGTTTKHASNPPLHAYVIRRAAQHSPGSWRL